VGAGVSSSMVLFSLSSSHWIADSTANNVRYCRVGKGRGGSLLLLAFLTASSARVLSKPMSKRLSRREDILIIVQNICGCFADVRCRTL